MTSRRGVPLGQRSGPHTPVVATAPTPSGELDPPPGTPCWVGTGPYRIPGVIPGWQQAEDGTWHALVSAWHPKGSVSPRTNETGAQPRPSP